MSQVLPELTGYRGKGTISGSAFFRDQCRPIVWNDLLELASSERGDHIFATLPSLLGFNGKWGIDFFSSALNGSRCDIHKWKLFISGVLRMSENLNEYTTEGISAVLDTPGLTFFSKQMNRRVWNFFPEFLEKCYPSTLFGMGLFRQYFNQPLYFAVLNIGRRHNGFEFICDALPAVYGGKGGKHEGGEPKYEGIGFFQAGLNKTTFDRKKWSLMVWGLENLLDKDWIVFAESLPIIYGGQCAKAVMPSKGIAFFKENTDEEVWKFLVETIMKVHSIGEREPVAGMLCSVDHFLDYHNEETWQKAIELIVRFRKRVGSWQADFGSCLFSFSGTLEQRFNQLADLCCDKGIRRVQGLVELSYLTCHVVNSFEGGFAGKGSLKKDPFTNLAFAVLRSASPATVRQVNQLLQELSPSVSITLDQLKENWNPSSSVIGLPMCTKLAKPQEKVIHRTGIVNPFGVVFDSGYIYQSYDHDIGSVEEDDERTGNVKKTIPVWMMLRRHFGRHYNEVLLKRYTVSGIFYAFEEYKVEQQVIDKLKILSDIFSHKQYLNPDHLYAPYYKRKEIPKYITKVFPVYLIDLNIVDEAAVWLKIELEEKPLPSDKFQEELARFRSKMIKKVYEPRKAA